MLHACREDIFFWINTFVWQYNPAKPGREIGPFITWDFQEEDGRVVLDYVLARRKDVLVEKSREMGWTWYSLIIYAWAGIFHEWKKFLAVSHSADAVDRSEDPDCLFWKVDFVLDYLPDWMAPNERRKMSRSFTRTRSYFNGAACTSRSGVGGRAAGILLDEFAKQKEDREILGQTADTGPRLIVSTHYGLDTLFYALTQRPDIKKIVTHWSRHPIKSRGLYYWDRDHQCVVILDKKYPFPPDYKFVIDGSPTGGPFPGLRSPWYDEECVRRQNARDVAMHLDIDPKGSMAQFFDQLLIQELTRTYCCEPYWEGDVHCDMETGRLIRFVPQPGGPLRLWTFLVNGLPAAGKYVIGGDISTGAGVTPSCLSIGNDLGEKVGEFASAHVTAERLAPIAVALSWAFKNKDGEGALLGWEVPGPGLGFGRRVTQDLGYRNIYYRSSDSQIHPDPTEIPGWYNSPESKRLLLEEYRAALVSRQYINRSERALEECKSFKYTPKGTVEHGGEASIDDPAGARINHGDYTIADAIQWRLVKTIGQKKRPPKKDVGPPVLSLAWRRQYHDRAEVEV